MTDISTVGLWCDDFDADLLAVVPGAVAALGPAAELELWTYNPNPPANGRINCPAAWHTDLGLASFFSTRDRSPVPAQFSTSRMRLVECSFLEAVRDEWVHGSVVVVNGRMVWDPPATSMYRLMSDLRGWTELDGADRSAIQSEVRVSLTRAAAAALQVAGA